VPALKYWPPYALLMARRRHIADDFLKVTRTEALAQYRDMEPEMRARARAGVLTLVDPKDALCPKDSCLYKINGRSLYYDDNHLSADGARLVAPTLEGCFRAPRPQHSTSLEPAG
jgi:hypothetical protein